MEAFAALGYKPEQVTKILLTDRVREFVRNNPTVYMGTHS